MLDFSEHGVEHTGIDAWVLAQCAQSGTLAFEILKYGTTQVGAIAYIEQIEQGCDRYMVIMRVCALGEEKKPVEQMLEP